MLIYSEFKGRFFNLFRISKNGLFEGFFKLLIFSGLACPKIDEIRPILTGCGLLQRACQIINLNYSKPERGTL